LSDEGHVGCAIAGPASTAGFDVEPDLSIESGGNGALDGADNVVDVTTFVVVAGIADEGIGVNVGVASRLGIVVGGSEVRVVAVFDPGLNNQEIVTLLLEALVSGS